MARKRKKKQPQKLDGKLKQVIDPTVAQALSHPLRGHILATLGDRIASPNEMAGELGINARDLDYHVKVLVRVGMIRLVRTAKRRGALEHFYELNSRVVYLDDADWKQIPQQIRTSFSAILLQNFLQEAAEALRAGTFNARENHESRTTMILDERGWSEMTKAMSETLERVLAIRKKSAKRLAEGSATGIPTAVFMLGFETAVGAKEKATSAAAADA